MRALVVVIIILSSVPGCATLVQECAGALLQASAQVCVDVLCDDSDGGDDFDDDAIDVPVAREEPPVPDWQPVGGDCEITAADDGVKVACADGTRAEFRPPAAEFARGGEGPPSMDVRDVDDTCTEGSIVRQGVDADGDGVLSPSELTGRTIDCTAHSPTLEGHLAIQSPEDVARLAGRRALTGGLHVRAPALVRLEAPQLQSLGGTLRVDRTPDLEVLRLPSLASVGGDVVITRAPRLRLVVVGALTRVGGSVIAVENPQLPQSDLEELVFRLSRRGFAGPVELAGNRP